MNPFEPNLLPQGFLHPDTGEWTREYELRELTAADQAQILDKRYAQANRWKWVGRVVAIGLESLGGQPIYQPYKASQYLRLPNILEQLTMNDATYLMTASRANSMGSKVRLRYECGVCEHKGIISFDLLDCDTVRAEAPIGSLTVALVRPYAIEDGAARGEWTSMQFRLPTLADCIAVKEARNTGLFLLDLFGRCVESLHGDAGVCDVMKQHGLGSWLMRNMSAANYTGMQEQILEVPRFDELIEVFCQQCDQPTMTTLGPTDILPI